MSKTGVVQDNYRRARSTLRCTHRQRRLCANGADFRELRALAAFDRKTAAAVLGVTERTIRNWEASRSRVPYSALELLRVLGCYGLPGAAWAGWSIRGDALYSPERLAFRARDAAWWSLTCSMARQWQQERAEKAAWCASARLAASSGCARSHLPLTGPRRQLERLGLTPSPVLTALAVGLDVKSGHGSATGCGSDAGTSCETSLPAKPGFRGPVQPLLFEARRAASPRLVIRGESPHEENQDAMKFNHLDRED